jgi:hypothetical protein
MFFLMNVPLYPKNRETIVGKADVGTDDLTMVVYSFRLENGMLELSGPDGGSDGFEDISLNLSRKSARFAI